MSWAAGDNTSKVITVNVQGDATVELNENFTVTLSNPTNGATITTATANGTIQDDDSVVTTFSNTSPITIQDLTASNPYPSTINVSGLSGNLASLKVTLTNLSHTYSDDIDILLVGPNGARAILMSDVGGGNSLSNITLTFDSLATAALPDVDPITSGTYLPTDVGTDDLFNSPAPSGPYGTDFSVFNNTNPNGVWSLYIMDDAGGDVGTIAGGWSLDIGTTTPVLPVITVLATDASAAETATGVTVNPGQFTLTRTGATTSSLTVNVLMSGTATNGTDYTNIPTTATFAVGSTTAVVNLNVIDDTLVEETETAILTVGTGTGYTVGTTPSATVSIADDDVLPVITVVATDASAAETATGITPNPGQFTLTRTGATTSSLTINVLMSGTATNGTDYTSIPTTATFAIGSTTAVVNLNVIDDTLVEVAETAILTVGTGTGYTVGTTPSATVNIADNDVALPVITVLATDASAAETATGVTVNPGQFTLTRTGATTSSLIVNVLMSGTATNGTDYTNIPTTATFAVGSTTAVVNLNVIDDTLVEGTETAILTVGTGTGYTVGTTPSATVSIADDDVLPVITVVATDASAAETATGITPNPGQFTLTRTGATTSSLTINVLMSGTAINGTDYTSIPTTATFAIGSTTAVVNLNVIDDTLVEVAETAILTVGTGTGYTVGTTPSATVNIADNDVALPVITVLATDASAAETATGVTVNPGQFTLTRTGATTSSLTVNVLMSGTATNGTDYTSIPTTATFAIGSTTAVVNLNVIDDTLVEVAETAILTVGTGTGYTVGTTPSATVNIADNDVALPSITLASNYSGVSENGKTNLIYTFNRAGDTTSPLTVNFSVSGTAINGDDYVAYGGAFPTPTQGTITFAVGATTAQLALVTSGDTVKESNETVGLTLTSGSGYQIGTPLAVTTTILNDDGVLNQQGTTGNDVIEAGSTSTLSGKAGNDILIGSSASNILVGGAGNDTLTTGTGFDTVLFTTKTEGIDTITDFNVYQDLIQVSAANFGGGLIAGESISSDQFSISLGSMTATTRFIFDQPTGKLYFDIDGSGVNAAVQFASLAANLGLTEDNIFVS